LTADVFDLEVIFVKELDTEVSPIGTKGLGEIGSVADLSSRCDTVQYGPVDERNLPIWVNHASRQSGSCPVLAALLIEVAAGTLDWLA
jgi:xanthine dehydrogenase YagR molybdenum-binding subunit